MDQPPARSAWWRRKRRKRWWRPGDALRARAGVGDRGRARRFGRRAGRARRRDRLRAGRGRGSGPGVVVVARSLGTLERRGTAAGAGRHAPRAPAADEADCGNDHGASGDCCTERRAGGDSTGSGCERRAERERGHRVRRREGADRQGRGGARRGGFCGGAGPLAAAPGSRSCGRPARPGARNTLDRPRSSKRAGSPKPARASCSSSGTIRRAPASHSSARRSPLPDEVSMGVPVDFDCPDPLHRHHLVRASDALDGGGEGGEHKHQHHPRDRVRAVPAQRRRATRTRLGGQDAKDRRADRGAGFAPVHDGRLWRGGARGQAPAAAERGWIRAGPEERPHRSPRRPCPSAPARSLRSSDGSWR